MMRLGVEVRDRKWKRKKYHNSFVGSEAVDWILEEQVNGYAPQAAVEIMIQRLPVKRRAVVLFNGSWLKYMRRAIINALCNRSR